MGGARTGGAVGLSSAAAARDGRDRRLRRIALRDREAPFDCHEGFDELRRLERPIAPAYGDLHQDPFTHQLIHSLACCPQ